MKLAVVMSISLLTTGAWAADPPSRATPVIKSAIVKATDTKDLELAYHHPSSSLLMGVHNYKSGAGIKLKPVSFRAGMKKGLLGAILGNRFEYGRVTKVEQLGDDTILKLESQAGLGGDGKRFVRVNSVTGETEDITAKLGFREISRSQTMQTNAVIVSDDRRQVFAVNVTQGLVHGDTSVAVNPVVSVKVFDPSLKLITELEVANVPDQAAELIANKYSTLADPQLFEWGGRVQWYSHTYENGVTVIGIRGGDNAKLFGSFNPKDRTFTRYGDDDNIEGKSYYGVGLPKQMKPVSEGEVVLDFPTKPVRD